MKTKELFKQLKQDQTMIERPLFMPILMHFAARYIGKTYGEFASDYRVFVDANVKCVEDFSMDSVGLISDPYREAAAFGADINFPAEQVPICRNKIVKTIDDVKALKNPDVYRSERTLDRINAARELRKRLGDDFSIYGWIEGPLAEACDLSDLSEMMMKLMMEPDFVMTFMDKLTITAKDFAKAQVEAGCDIIGMGDAICSQISAEKYREFVLEKHAEIIEYIHSLGAMVKLHICGNITHLLDDIKQAQPDIVDIDHLVDMNIAHEKLGDDIICCGNLDPVSVIQNLSSDEVFDKTKTLLHNEKNKRFALSGGCEITVNTPKENLMSMRRACRL